METKKLTNLEWNQVLTVYVIFMLVLKLILNITYVLLIISYFNLIIWNILYRYIVTFIVSLNVHRISLKYQN